jgi:PAB-dependent poly(A)-specific ribonuclease subunit 2
MLLVPCRLALARVSVLRGSGPAAGTAFIDDYVACVEPVVDYLTRWSGIRPGDYSFTLQDEGWGRSRHLLYL